MQGGSQSPISGYKLLSQQQNTAHFSIKPLLSPLNIANKSANEQQTSKTSNMPVTNKTISMMTQNNNIDINNVKQMINTTTVKNDSSHPSSSVIKKNVRALLKKESKFRIFVRAKLCPKQIFR